MKPTDFVFAVAETEGIVHAVIMPAAYWRQYRRVYDGEAYDDYIEELCDVSRLEESTFEPNETMSRTDLHAHLLACGLVADPALATFVDSPEKA